MTPPRFERHDEHHEGIPVLESILIELRELRTDFNRNARECGERLATLEIQLDTILGDKQPGRLTIAENKISDLQHWRWRIAGIATGISAAVGAVLHFWK